MLRIVGWLLTRLIAWIIWLVLVHALAGDVVALPLGDCELWAYTGRQVAASACPGHDLIRVWPLPVISPWFADPFEPLTGQQSQCCGIEMASEDGQDQSVGEVRPVQRAANLRLARQPKIVAALNGQYVKLARLEGEFIWHHHAAEDELLLVVQGHLTIEFRDRAVALGPGELIVVPAGPSTGRWLKRRPWCCCWSRSRRATRVKCRATGR